MRPGAGPRLAQPPAGCEGRQRQCLGLERPEPAKSQEPRAKSSVGLSTSTTWRASITSRLPYQPPSTRYHVEGLTDEEARSLSTRLDAESLGRGSLAATETEPVLVTIGR